MAPLFPFFFFFFLNFIYLFIYLFIGCIGSSLLRAGFLFVAMRGLLTAVASLVAEHGL